MNDLVQEMDTEGTTDPFGCVLLRLSRIFAVSGGFILVALIAVTVASVIGREVFSTPIPGDFELVEIGCAVAVFAFLPYCQMIRGNVIVDFFTRGASLALRRYLDALGALGLFLIAALLTWRLLLGAADMARVGEETMLLAIPLWWAFVPIVVSSALLTLVSLYTVWHSLKGTRQ